jgi:hypothetical protein
MKVPEVPQEPDTSGIPVWRLLSPDAEHRPLRPEGGTDMARWWTELWSLGAGPSRIYCGIAQTVEGFAVDVFYGDTCIDSEVYPTRASATRAAQARKRHYSCGRLVASMDVVTLASPSLR